MLFISALISVVLTLGVPLVAGVSPSTNPPGALASLELSPIKLESHLEVGVQQVSDVPPFLYSLVKCPNFKAQKIERGYAWTDVQTFIGGIDNAPPVPNAPEKEGVYRQLKWVKVDDDGVPQTYCVEELKVTKLGPNEDPTLPTLVKWVSNYAGKEEVKQATNAILAELPDFESKAALDQEIIDKVWVHLEPAVRAAVQSLLDEERFSGTIHGSGDLSIPEDEKLKGNWEKVAKDKPIPRLTSVPTGLQQSGCVPPEVPMDGEYLTNVCQLPADECTERIKPFFSGSAQGFHCDASNKEIKAVRSHYGRNPNMRYFNVWLAWKQVDASPLGFIEGLRGGRGANDKAPNNPDDVSPYIQTTLNGREQVIVFKDMDHGDFVIFDSLVTYHAALPLVSCKINNLDQETNLRISSEFRFHFELKEKGAQNECTF